MNWVLTVLVSVVVVELVLRLPFGELLAVLRRFGLAGVRVVAAPGVSDHWKEKAMGAYARRTFTASLKIAGLITATLGAAFCVIWLLDRLSGGFQAFILSWTGLGASLLSASVYVLIRRAAQHA